MRYYSTLALAILTIFFVSSCNSNKQNYEPFLNISNNVIEDKFGDCDGSSSCGKIEIEYPFFSNNSKSSDDKLNQFITKSITSFYKVETVEQTSKKFIDEFTSFTEDFPDNTNNKWFVSMHYKVISNNDNTLSLAFHMEGYTGGAHGFSTLTYSNFNPKTGDKLKLEDIITNVDELRIIARNTFIEENDLDPSKSLNTQGFWFKDDIFSLNKNFIISSKEMIFHYNQYEIAPYAEGPIEIIIPLSKLEGLFK